ncbi:PQQ-binding-like beta-propeller repeat protein [Streptacidiphilus sp. ASG 303]|uniref:outer membrane protein assembly factor BamB family protein n=1 Tax=Streptacidiphilus sp. ASG 303 TaxID=2896847 RepID=UPI001E5F6B9D|nr:PQQ-binding-like beta-propeller repeat protein [Streptacidiphilus sp. ASG 303]MCD0483274.1 PQQ-binding-like beta-propeller repeat protein [Streptacidiphilus sp. ASG 303]
MAQEPSGSGGQQPSEYEYGQQWHTGQASSAEGGIPGGHQAYGDGAQAWGDPAQAYQGYYGGHAQQPHDQAHGQQPYGTQAYDPAPYGQQSQGWTGYDPAGYAQQPYEQYGGSYGGHGDGVYAGGHPYADPAGPYGTPDPAYGGSAQSHQDGRTPGSHDPGAAGADGEATQQWQALPDQGAPFPPPPAGPPAGSAPEPPSGAPRGTYGSTGDGTRDDADDDAGGTPRPALADRLRAALTGGTDGPDRRTLAVRAAVGAGALAVLVAAGVYVAGGDDPGSPAASGGTAPAPAGFSVDHTRAWAAPAAPAGADDALQGSWLLPGAVVRGDGSGVRAYDPASGRQLWTLQPPKPGAVPCGMSPTAAAGTGAVLWTPRAGGKNCTLLSAVDTATGRQKWTKTLSDTKDSYGARVMVNDTRVVAVGDSEAVGYEASSGKEKWSNAGRGKFCTLSGTGSGSTVLLHSSCADSSPKEQAVTLDAGSGRLVWWRGLGSPRTVSVLSAEPAVVLTTGDKESDDKVRSWDGKGNPGAEIPVAQAGGARLDVGHGSLDAAPGVFFSGTTLATALVPADGSTPANGSLTAVDLKSGRTLWRTTAKEKGKVQPVGIDGGALVVSTEERTDQPAHLSRFALADGGESAGGGFPKGTGSLLTAGRLLSADGTVVAVPAFTSTYGTSATAYRARG